MGMEQPLSRGARYLVIGGTVFLVGIFTFGVVQSFGPAMSFVSSLASERTGGSDDVRTAPTDSSGNSVAAGGTTALTMAELATHNTAKDCWLLVAGKIYDVTSFIPRHPGGSVIAKSCGTDATQAFNTKGGEGKDHSSRADSMLAQYYIGDLNQNISSGALQQVQQNAAAATPAGGGEDENEDEDEWEDD